MEQFNNLEQQEALNKTRATDKVLDTTHLTNKDPYTITHDAMPLSSCCFRWLLPAAAAGVVEMVAAAAAAAEMASVAAQMDAAAAVVRILLGSLAKDFWIRIVHKENLKADRLSLYIIPAWYHEPMKDEHSNCQSESHSAH